MISSPEPQSPEVSEHESLELNKPELQEMPEPEPIEMSMPELQEMPETASLEMPETELIETSKPESVETPSPILHEGPKPELFEPKAIEAPETDLHGGEEPLEWAEPESHGVPEQARLEVPAPVIIEEPKPELIETPDPLLNGQHGAAQPETPARALIEEPKLEVPVHQRLELSEPVSFERSKPDSTETPAPSVAPDPKFVESPMSAASEVPAPALLEGNAPTLQKGAALTVHELPAPPLPGAPRIESPDVLSAKLQESLRRAPVVEPAPAPPSKPPAEPVAPSPMHRRWPRVLMFCALVPALWAADFAWRPPAPMLGLHHQEHLGRNSTDISVTFDDAPHPLTTSLLLASLKRADVRATFFCIGGNLRLYPELAHRMVEEGHELANHSEPHHNLTTVDPAKFAAHIDAGFASIARVERDAGKKGETTRLFRPPGGGLNRAAIQYLYDHNYTLAWWSNNVGDWTCPPAWKIADGVKAHLEPGDIILLHDGGTGTPQALPAIIKAARKKGLRTVLMPERKK